MDKIKAFIMNHRVATIITGVVVVCLVSGGVAFGVHQSNVAKEKAAIEAQKKEEAEKKAAEKKKAEEEAKKAEEEAAEAEAEVEEEVEVVAEATESSNTQSSNTQSSNTQSSNAQSSSAQSQSAPAQTQTSEEDWQNDWRYSSEGCYSDEYLASIGMVQDAYGNWMPSTSFYVVKEGVGGTLLYSNGYKVVGSEAYDIFAEQIDAWRREYHYQNGTSPSHEEEVEYVYNLSMQ